MKKYNLLIAVAFLCYISAIFSQSKNTQTEKLSIDSPNSLRSLNNFETYLYDFLLISYSEQNIDSLVHVSSPIIMKYVNKKIGFGRFWNMGMSCNLYKSNGFGYNFNEDYFGTKQPNISSLPFFHNLEPEGGFCIEATSPDGIYYKQIHELPRDFDMEKGSYIPTPMTLKSLNKKVVYIQFENWIVKKFYFVQMENSWFLIYIDDCDCSA